MTTHNPFAGETPFPLAGEDVVFKFTTNDILQLYSLYGPDPRAEPEVDPVTNRIRNHFWSTVLGRAEAHDPHVLFNLCRIGLKERVEDKLVSLRSRRDQDWWDDLPFAWSEAADTIVSGLTWSRWGLTPDQLAAQMREQVAQIEREQREGAAGVPQTGMTESPTSSA